MKDLYMMIRARYEDLSHKQRQVADVILSSPMASSYSTAAELATAAGVTKATVVRFGQSLGFSGYAELRHLLRGPRSLEHLWPLDLLKSNEPAAASQGAAQASLRQDASNLQRLLSPEMEQAVVEAVAAIKAARRVLVISAGSHAATGLMLTHNLTFMGKPAELENRGGSYLGQALSVLTSEDLVIAVAFWHVQREIVHALDWCNEQRIPTMALTDNPVSPSSRRARHSVVIPSESTSFFRSQTAAVAVVNAILSELAASDKNRTVAAMARAQNIWKKLDIYSSENP